MKTLYILGGGTFYDVRTHFSLAAPAFGETAKTMFNIINEQKNELNVKLTLTKMADSNSNIKTNEDVSSYLDMILSKNDTAGIIFNVAMCDFEGQIGDIKSNKYAPRLQSRENNITMNLIPSQKVISKIKNLRSDVILVGFKTTSNESKTDQIEKSLRQIKESNSDFVIANDVVTYSNLLISNKYNGYIGAEHLDKNRYEFLKKCCEEIQKVITE